MSTMEYTLIQSARKSIGLRVLPDGSVEVRAPRRIRKSEIDTFVRSKEAWILKTQQKLSRQAMDASSDGILTAEEIRELADRALKVIPERVKYYAPLVGVTYGRITIRNQRTRWGSCSSGGNLNFNCLLMLAPPEVLDSVVVHELCHRLEMNHSPRFYAEVLRVYPDYRRCERWLKEHGTALMLRMPH